MDQSLTLGLWSSNFGAVKIERDHAAGEDAVMGVWLYERDGADVIGYFVGSLRGNVLEFDWHEPAQPMDLRGSGFISFTSDGLSFSGRWWSDDQSRNGVFHAKRDAVYAPNATPNAAPDATPDTTGAPPDTTDVSAPPEDTGEL